MLCSISGEAPQEPVVSKKSGNVYEKRLIEKYIDEHGKEPGTDDDLDKEDLLEVKSSRVVRPRPAALTSIPALLASFQNEWDSLALETYNLQQQLTRTREELAHALYQHDAAVRVIARLTQERNQARDALAKVTVSAAPVGAPAAAANGGGDTAMAVDSELPQEIVEQVDETAQLLSKSRKKRPVPPGWASPDDISTLQKVASDPTPVQQATSIGVDGGYAAVGGLSGDVAVYSIEGGQVERTLKVDEPVTDVLWTGTKVVFGTARGSVKVFDSGSEVASFADHAGQVTAVALHPGSDLVASVGADRGIVLYQLGSLRKVFQSYTDSPLTTCAFHPDGALVAAGTVSGEIKLFHTKTLQEAASFSLGAPIESLAFSENGYWFAAVAKAQTGVTIFDLRKAGDAARVKTLDVGGAVSSLAWDYTGRFLAAAGAGGISVQGYNKSSKAWTELLRKAETAVAVRWGPEAKRLVAVKGEGVVEVFGLPAAAEAES